ncbi:MAG: VCBS repeat-containing protein [Albidovulum sp.]
MPGKARHQLSRLWQHMARRALYPTCLLLAAFGVSTVQAADIVSAEYGSPTGRYPHGALGDTIEHASLIVTLKGGATLGIRLRDDLVFEDTAPRLADVDGDGRPDVIAVESHTDKGARLVVWSLQGDALLRLAATPYIGRRFRWLAPVGAADLDGDGQVEIAYIETPHLGKTLKIVRIVGKTLAPVAKLKGLTNHKIGDPLIQGRIATCKTGLTILTANANWSRIIATTLHDGKLTSRDVAPYNGPKSFDHVTGCS